VNLVPSWLSTMSLLELRSLSKHFGGVRAVNDLNLSIEKGEIIGLIGPNGAGKTTVFNLVSGVFPPSSGRVIFRGEDITGLKPHRIAGKGLARTFQHTMLVGEMTVLQNVVLACHLTLERTPLAVLLDILGVRDQDRRSADRANELIEFLGLTKVRSVSAKNLPHGHQRSLAIAMALASEPQLIMLDEPVAGMNAVETMETVNRIRLIRDRGTTILLVEHDMKMVMGLCERICVLNFGTKIAEGNPEEIRSNRQVIEAYLGRKHAAEPS
jgi:branched-chain amino acid transport system ATP-binding protein